MSKAILRAKVRVNSVLEVAVFKGDNVIEMPKDKQSERITFDAVYSDDPNSENKQWSTWTPFFTSTMDINNPSAWGKLEKGKEYYIDFIPAEDE
jgi:hypothetical protein